MAKVDKRTKAYSLGIGYYKPANMSEKEFRELYKTWNAKLDSLSHSDIESFDRSATGHFSPFFRRSHGYKSNISSAIYTASKIRPDAQEYFRLVSCYAECVDFKKYWPKKTRYHKLYYYLLRLHADGYTYRKILKLTNERQAYHSLKERYTFTRLFLIIKMLLEPMFEWHKTDPEGLLLPESDDDEG